MLFLSEFDTFVPTARWPGFQVYKQYFKDACNEEDMWGGSANKKRDFFGVIGDVRKRSLTQRIVKP